MTMLMTATFSGEMPEWWIERTASVIQNLRRTGKSDADITLMLLNKDPLADTGIPMGPTQETIVRAFDRVAILAPQGKDTSCVAAKPFWRRTSTYVCIGSVLGAATIGLIAGRLSA